MASHEGSRRQVHRPHPIPVARNPRRSRLSPYERAYCVGDLLYECSWSAESLDVVAALFLDSVGVDVAPAVGS